MRTGKGGGGPRRDIRPARHVSHIPLSIAAKTDALPLLALHKVSHFLNYNQHTGS